MLLGLQALLTGPTILFLPQQLHLLVHVGPVQPAVLLNKGHPLHWAHLFGEALLHTGKRVKGLIGQSTEGRGPLAPRVGLGEGCTLGQTDDAMQLVQTHSVRDSTHTLYRDMGDNTYHMWGACGM